MTSRTCAWAPCAAPIPGRARAATRFCSPRCRVAAHRAGQSAPRTPIPSELRVLDRWVRYSAGKVPLTIDGAAASSTDPSTWSTYRAASRSGVGAGLGFVLAGDGVLCLDLDHVLHTPGPGAELVTRRHITELLDRLPATYTEVSPGGAGLHVWLRGQLARGGVHRIHGVRVEAYSSARFMTMTGRRWGESPSTIAVW